MRRGVTLHHHAAAERYAAVRCDVTMLCSGGGIVGPEVRVVAVCQTAAQAHRALGEDRPLEGEAVKHLGGGWRREGPEAEEGQEDQKEATRAGDSDPLAHHATLPRVVPEPSPWGSDGRGHSSA